MIKKNLKVDKVAAHSRTSSLIKQRRIKFSTKEKKIGRTSVNRIIFTSINVSNVNTISKDIRFLTHNCIRKKKKFMLVEQFSCIDVKYLLCLLNEVAANRPMRARALSTTAAAGAQFNYI